MPTQRSPGWRKAYDKARARRHRIQQHVLKDYLDKHPDDYAAAWADGETQEHQRKAEG